MSYQCMSQGRRWERKISKRVDEKAVDTGFCPTKRGVIPPFSLVTVALQRGLEDLFQAQGVTTKPSFHKALFSVTGQRRKGRRNPPGGKQEHSY